MTLYLRSHRYEGSWNNISRSVKGTSVELEKGGGKRIYQRKEGRKGTTGEDGIPGRVGDNIGKGGCL